jgi:phospholipid/cholesterol/gamma-HCH transport system permease protein
VRLSHARDAGAEGKLSVNGASLLDRKVQGDRLELLAGGDWTADNAAAIERLIERVMPGRRETLRNLRIDMTGIEKLDTYGAWLLERLVRGSADRGLDTRIVGLADRFKAIVETVQQTAKLPPPPPRRRNVVAVGLDTVGRNMAEIARSLLMIAQMFGAVAIAALRVLAKPHTFRLTSMINQVDLVGWRAVPIILLITFLIGAILAQQGIFHFRKFGADVFVVDMVGILVLREIGVLIVCVMVAGRSGSAYTAELGSMKMREEIDALRTMGFDPVGILILPRIVALVLAVPMLTFIGEMAALYGGGLVIWLYGGISPEVFVQRLREVITLDHFLVGMIKAPFMALVIGIVACVEGLETEGSAESLGLRTTASVVKSIFLVIVLDGIFAMFFAAIGK